MNTTTRIEGTFGRFSIPIKMTFDSVEHNGRMVFDMTTRTAEGEGFWDERYNKTFDTEKQMKDRIKREIKKGGIVK